MLWDQLVPFLGELFVGSELLFVRVIHLRENDLGEVAGLVLISRLLRDYSSCSPGPYSMYVQHNPN